MTATGTIRYLDLTKAGVVSSGFLDISSVVDTVPEDGVVIVATFIDDAGTKRSVLGAVHNGQYRAIFYYGIHDGLVYSALLGIDFSRKRANLVTPEY